MSSIFSKLPFSCLYLIIESAFDDPILGSVNNSSFVDVLIFISLYAQYGNGNLKKLCNLNFH